MAVLIATLDVIIVVRLAFIVFTGKLLTQYAKVDIARSEDSQG